MFLHHKVDISMTSNDGWMASQTACHKGYEEVLRSIVDNQADLTPKTSQGRTPLHATAHNGHPTLIELLLKAGAALEPRIMMVGHRSTVPATQAR